MEIREIVMQVIAPHEPLLARRILALLWSYERGDLRDRLFHEPLRRRRAAAKRECQDGSEARFGKSPPP